MIGDEGDVVSEDILVESFFPDHHHLALSASVKKRAGIVDPHVEALGQEAMEHNELVFLMLGIGTDVDFLIHDLLREFREFRGEGFEPVVSRMAASSTEENNEAMRLINEPELGSFEGEFRWEEFLAKNWEGEFLVEGNGRGRGHRTNRGTEVECCGENLCFREEFHGGSP